jgi:anti-sigma B factor antagonist
MVRPSSFEIRSECDTDSGRLTVSGELDIATRPELEEAVGALLARGARTLVIELGELTFIDSSGLGLLIVLNELATNDGWTLQLTRPRGQVLSVVELTGADDHLPFIDPPDRN